MLNISEVLETNRMILEENLDVRTITMGISLLDCADASLKRTCDKIYAKLMRLAKDLVRTGDEIGREFGIPIVNKRISITPAAIVGAACCKRPSDFVRIAKTLDRAAKKLGVNFIGGYSAVVSKGMTPADELLIRSIPEAMAKTEHICSSVNVGSTKTGIDMDAVRLMGEIIKATAERTKARDSLGCAKLVVLCNAPDDNPFMAGAFHGVTEGDAVINVGVSGPGVVNYVLRNTCRGADFETLCETIKRTAFKITRVGQLVAQEASKRLGVPFGIGIAVINGNYAISAGLDLADAVYNEQLGEGYYNVIAVRTEDKDSSFSKDIVSIVHSDDFRNVIEDESKIYKAFNKPADYDK